MPEERINQTRLCSNIIQLRMNRTHLFFSRPQGTASRAGVLGVTPDQLLRTQAIGTTGQEVKHHLVLKFLTITMHGLMYRQSIQYQMQRLAPPLHRTSKQRDEQYTVQPTPLECKPEAALAVDRQRRRYAGWMFTFGHTFRRYQTHLFQHLMRYRAAVSLHGQP